MYKYYIVMLGIVDKLNEWNDQLNEFAGKHMDNVATGTLLFFVLIAVAFWAVGELNKNK